MTEEKLKTATIEEVFQDYMEAYYKLKPEIKTSNRYNELITCLRDAFFGGIAIASISDKDYSPELVIYIHADKARRMEVKPERTDREWVH